MPIKDMLVQTQLKSMSNLMFITFQVYYENVNEIILNRKLFYNVAYIKFEGIINGIENEGIFLNNYENLLVLTLTFSNMEEFFHMGTQWMTALNGKCDESFLNINNNTLPNLNEINAKKMSLFLIKKSTTTFDSLYAYPNEDFCLFKSYCIFV